jgi:chromosome segregation ATPase
MASATETAEDSFRAAFKRLKEGKPQVLPSGTPVSQNNVATEAGTDTTALKKSRYPALIREIQAYVEIAGHERAAQKERKDRKRRRKEDLETKSKSYQAQRDDAQSQVMSAKRLVLELLLENASLKARIDKLDPPPTPLRSQTQGMDMKVVKLPEIAG